MQILTKYVKMNNNTNVCVSKIVIINSYNETPFLSTHDKDQNDIKILKTSPTISNPYWDLDDTPSLSTLYWDQDELEVRKILTDLFT